MPASASCAASGEPGSEALPSRDSRDSRDSSLLQYHQHVSSGERSQSHKVITKITKRNVGWGGRQQYDEFAVRDGHKMGRPFTGGNHIVHQPAVARSD